MLILHPRAPRRSLLCRVSALLALAALAALAAGLLHAPAALTALAAPPTAEQVARAEDPSCDPAAVAALKPNQLLAHVRGMVCGFCVQGVEKLVGALEGVVSAKVELEAGSVLITVDPARAPTTEQLRAAVHEAGYELKDVHAPPAPTPAAPAPTAPAPAPAPTPAAEGAQPPSPPDPAE